MLNTVCLMGRLTSDPELKTTPNGVSVVSVNIAVDRNYVQKGQERQTDFIPLVFWRHTADFVARNFHKGQLIAVRGEIRMEQYTDKELNKRTKFSVVCEEAMFCGDKPKSATAAPSASAPAPNFTAPAAGTAPTQNPYSANPGTGYAQPSYESDFEPLDTDEDLPF